jgi:dihydrofolate reductase
MRKLRYSVAASLDGYIAGPNGEFDWILMDPEIDFGAMYESFGGIVMGRRSYEVFAGAGAPAAPALPTYVYSRTLPEGERDGVTFARDAVSHVRALKEGNGKRLWLWGGGELFRQLAEADLVDGVDVAIIPGPARRRPSAAACARSETEAPAACAPALCRDRHARARLRRRPGRGRAVSGGCGRVMPGGAFPVILSQMRVPLFSALCVVVAAAAVQAWQAPDYGALWEKATPFHEFLENVKARQNDWRSRFANAAIEAAALNDARALPGRRRILAVATDRCSDSAWALPYIGKLAAAVPEKLEVRVIDPKDGSRIQSAHLTPDGRIATPTIVVLDEHNRYVGGWVERPADLQAWFIENKPTLTSEELHAHVSKWYTDDAGRSTIRELLVILGRNAAEGK